jgi:ring-1,2-phenylacetyl-CoA epoxidase subunit PaaA
VDARTQEFLAYVQDGGQVEATDWLPDEYRQKLVKFIEMHGNSELMGVLPEREWILRAPTLQRKLALHVGAGDQREDHVAAVEDVERLLPADLLHDPRIRGV